MIGCDALRDSLKLFEYEIAIVGGVLNVSLFIERREFFELCALFDQSDFPSDLFDLFGFEIVFDFEFGNLKQFFVNVSHLLL